MSELNNGDICEAKTEELVCKKIIIIIDEKNTYHIDKDKLISNSLLIRTILEENPLEEHIPISIIKEKNLIKEFRYFLKFLELKEYVEIPTPLPEKGAHFTEKNIGNQENVDFINNFYDKTIINEKKIPIELQNTIWLANYLGATKFLGWCCAKFASVLIELGIHKID